MELAVIFEMQNLAGLATHDRSGALRAVIETPARSGVKLTYEPGEGLFVFGRPLVLGVVYPYDYGFIPSTLADDGDPLDVMVYHDGSSFPGVVIPCCAVGVVRLVQRRKKKHTHQRNDRIIAVPVRDQRIRDARDLNGAVRAQLEQFFVSAVLMDDKHVHVEGWSGPKHAEKLIAEARRAFGAK